jgi:AcrR family transcriptional regulator
MTNTTKGQALDRNDVQGGGRKMMAAAISQAGEAGLHDLSVDGICRESGVRQGEFEALFADAADCFVCAHAVEMEQLTAEALNCDIQDLETMLDRLAATIAANPARSRALFLEAQSAGEAALRSRRRFVAELARRVDDFCRADGHPDVPPIAAEFVAHVIDHLISQALIEDGTSSFRSEVPSLVSLVRDIYGASAGHDSQHGPPAPAGIEAQDQGRWSASYSDGYYL